MIRSAYLPGLLAAATLLAGCASMTAGSVRDLDKPAPGILGEKSDAELVSRERDRGVPPADLRPVHDKGLELTKRSEGWVPRLYNDAAGYCTIGYGHLIRKARCDYPTEKAEYKPTITTGYGTTLLVSDMADAQVAVLAAVKVQLNDYQYSALTDFVYNVGGANFRKSALLRKVNAKQFEEVPAQLMRWTKAGGKPYLGLIKRRKAEVGLFFFGQDPKVKEKASKAVPAADESGPIDIVTGDPAT